MKSGVEKYAIAGEQAVIMSGYYKQQVLANRGYNSTCCFRGQEILSCKLS